MKLNREAIYKLIEHLGWSERRLAQELDLHYSYVYRVLRKQRGIGKKFIVGLMKLCEQQGLNYKNYIIYDEVIYN